jgi:hypothetical protein
MIGPPANSRTCRVTKCHSRCSDSTPHTSSISCPLCLTLYPDIELFGVDYNEDDPTLAAAQLQAHPDLAGIFGTNLFGAEGAATAVREAG